MEVDGFQRRGTPRAMKLRATLCFVLVMLVGVMLGHGGLTIGLTRSLRICLITN